MPLRRRDLLAWPGLAASALAADAAPTTGVLRLATAWRVPTGATWRVPTGADGRVPTVAAAGPDEGHQAGVLRVDWAAGRIEVETAVPLPTRAHGLLALGDAGSEGFVVVANRPGRWLLRCDARGVVQRLHALHDERPARTLNGHVVASACGRWLFSTETDAATGEGWIGVRDGHSLQRVAQFPSHGLDPHQLLRAADGTLLVANGGIARDAQGRKRPGEAVRASLVRLEPGTGERRGQWRLDDPQLSIRHLAWSATAAGATPRLGVALQAEHAPAAAREHAPVLAVWEGQQLVLPSLDEAACEQAGGYAGDIAAAPGGGFVLSAQKRGRCLWWDPAQPETLQVVAELTEPCALAAAADARGVFIGAGRGLGRWHAQQPPRLLRWPMAMAPDNHAVRLGG